MRVVFSNRAYASILAETTEKITTETGGLFLGTVKDDVWYVIEAIDPGPKSIFEVAYFEYDQKYTQHLINKIANLYDEKLTLIGLWHRHPGSFDQFSSTDDGTNAKYASLNRSGAISALVNIDPSFRLTVYHVGRPCRYRKIRYDVGDDLIPNELLRLKTPERFMNMMDNALYSSNQRRNSRRADYHVSVSLDSFMRFILPTIADRECDKEEIVNLMENEAAQEALMDDILDDIGFLTDELNIEVAMTMNEQYIMVYQDAIDKVTQLYFLVSKSDNSTILFYEGQCYSYKKGLLKEACVKAKAKKDAETRNDQTAKPRRKNGMVDNVIKIIRFNRNED